MSSATSPGVSISYSWEDKEHQSWVERLATRLRDDGVYVSLDKWNVELGQSLTEYMEALVRDHERVLVICTPEYKERSEKRQGGVGYEGSLMTAELLKDSTQRKFIPVLRSGDWTSAPPSWIAGRAGVDLREDDEAEYTKLLSALQSLSKRTTDETPPRANESVSRPPVDTTTYSNEEASGPIRIIGIVDEKIASPKGDGSPGSALYAVPFRLSRTPSRSWAERLKQNWDRPPSFTSMHRPGIARVRGNQLILDGTTMDEVERFHLKTLKLAIEKTNEEVEAFESRERAEAKRRMQQEADHRKNVSDISKRLDFD